MRRLMYGIGLLFLITLLWSPVARAEDGDNHAALVIRYPDGAIQTQCVAFSESSISGEELLNRAELTTISDYNSGMGGAVCSINNQGCAYPKNDCFCQCQGVSCEYWAFYHWVGGGWQYSSVGVSSYRVTDGALEGMSWGPGDFVAGTAPPVIAFDEICAPSTPTATPTATPVPPSPTPSPLPTATATIAAAPASTVRLPEIHLTADSSFLAAGTCTVLKWVTWDAKQVTLNGAPVLAQDRQEVCPMVSQPYLLVAANDAGQTQKEIEVTVAEPIFSPTAPLPVATLASPTALATPEPNNLSVVTLSQPPSAALDTLVVPNVLPVSGDAISPTVMPARPPQGSVATGTEVAPTAMLASKPLSVDMSTRLPTATSISLPTVVPTSAPSLGMALTPLSGATPTPILVAFVAASEDKAVGRAQNEQATVSTNFVPPDRSFSRTLLPGYAAFLLTSACLLGAAVVVVRRRTPLIGDV
jgi:hypothetical protein